MAGYKGGITIDGTVRCVCRRVGPRVILSPIDRRLLGSIDTAHMLVAW